MNVFDTINERIESVESSVVTLATTLIPWLTPLLPAWMTYYHLKTIPGITGFIAATTGFAVELFGLAAVSTLFSLMRHNKEQRAQKRKMTLVLPVAAYVFYIFVVVVVNVIMEIPMAPQYHKYVQISAIALLTLMSTPAYVITVSRQQQREIEMEFKDRKFPKVSEVSKEENDPILLHWRRLPMQDKERVFGMTIKEIQHEYKRSEKTATNWKKYADKMFFKENKE